MINKTELEQRINNAQKELNEAKALLSKLPSKSAEERMTEIWRSCNIVKYSSDKCRTYFKDEEPMFQQDWNTKKLYYRYVFVYKVFLNEYKMSENDINNLVIKVLSKDINCNNLSGGVAAWDVWFCFF